MLSPYAFRRAWARYVPTLAALVLLLALAYWRAISTYRAPYRILTDQPTPVWVDQLYAFRWVVRGAMAAAVAALAAVEVYAQAVTRQLQAVFARRWRAAAFVALLALAGRSYLLTPGRMALLDGLNNMASIITVRAAWLQGHWPPYFWSNYAWMGFPWLQFHNALFYYQGAFLDLFLRDAYLSMKLAVLANHMLAALFMFAFVRRVARSPWAALVSAVAWSASFFHYHYFVHVGSAHLSLLLPLLPAALWLVEGLISRGPARRLGAGLAAVAGLALWVHAYYGALTLALTALYAVARLALLRGVPWGARLGLLAGGLALGCLAALSQWLPPFVERNLVGQWNRGLQFIQPNIGWADILSFRQSFLTPDYYGGYVGLSVFALALAALAFALLTRDRRAVGLAAWLAVALYLSLGPRYLPYDEIFSRLPGGELIYAIRYPGKYLLFAEFALSALAGLAIREAGRLLALARRAGLRLPGTSRLQVRRLAVMAAGVVAAEMIFFTLQVNSLFPETWIAIEPGHQEAYDWILAHGDRTSRVLDKSYSHMEVSALSGQPSFFSHIEETPPASVLYYWLANDALGEDLAEGELRQITRDGLYLLDVGYVMIAETPPSDAGWPLGYEGQPFSVWLNAAHAPAVAAPALRVVTGAEARNISELINAMDLRFAENAAGYIMVAEPVDDLPAGEGGAVTLDITGYKVDLDRVVLDYDLSQPAYLQLAYSAYPYLQVYLDGQRADDFTTALHLVGLRSPAGAHHIELRPTLSPLRVAAYWLDLVGVLVIVALASLKRTLHLKP